MEVCRWGRHTHTLPWQRVGSTLAKCCGLPLGPSGPKCPGSVRKDVAENGGVQGSAPQGVSRGPSAPGLRRVEKVSPTVSKRCPRRSGHTWDTFWTLESPGPGRPQTVLQLQKLGPFTEEIPSGQKSIHAALIFWRNYFLKCSQLQLPTASMFEELIFIQSSLSR